VTRTRRLDDEEVFPYPLFPEPCGVLPWGDIASPGVAFWLTGPGDPDRWPVVVATEECDYWDRFDGTACEFLTAEFFACRTRPPGPRSVGLSGLRIATPDGIFGVYTPETGLIREP
jgi:hypothetical protein